MIVIENLRKGRVKNGRKIRKLETGGLKMGRAKQEKIEDRRKKWKLEQKENKKRMESEWEKRRRWMTTIVKVEKADIH